MTHVHVLVCTLRCSQGDVTANVYARGHLRMHKQAPML